MSKIAQYLNEHLVGEVTGVSTIRDTYGTDGSVLQIVPELVVYPKVTNDIRKTARFTWQLAEKGHVLGMTPRGLGGDTTGGAIGAGIVLDLSRHLNDILYIGIKDKQKIIHVQPGVTINTLNQTLKWHGLTLGAYKTVPADMTLGGMLASGAAGVHAGRYRAIGDMVSRLEVVLANGDVIETSRISQRELNKKKGEQTLEGEIYRQIDGVIEDNAELVASLSSQHDNVGYRIDQVKHKDGSFDLTPLLIGSQGTLGIISEAVLETDFYSDGESAMVVMVNSAEEARDIADALVPLQPAMLRLIDSEYFVTAKAHGKKFVFDKEPAPFQAVVYAAFDDISDKVHERKLKKAVKLLAKYDVRTYTSDDERLDDLYAVRDVLDTVRQPLRADETRTTICDGAYIPAERREEFAGAVAVLAERHHTTLPLVVDALSGIVSVYPSLHLARIADKQKVFKLASDYVGLVHSMGGTIAGRSAEGRFHAFTAHPQLDAATRDVYAAIRKAFDPFGTLNPGVKQAGELKTLVRMLKKD